MKCPSCGKEIGENSICSCGWADIEKIRISLFDDSETPTSAGETRRPEEEVQTRSTSTPEKKQNKIVLRNGMRNKPQPIKKQPLQPEIPPDEDEIPLDDSESEVSGSNSKPHRGQNKENTFLERLKELDKKYIVLAICAAAAAIYLLVLLTGSRPSSTDPRTPTQLPAEPQATAAAVQEDASSQVEPPHVAEEPPATEAPSERYLADLDYYSYDTTDSYAPNSFREINTTYYDPRDNTGGEHERVLITGGHTQYAQTYLLGGDYAGLRGCFYLRFDERDCSAKARLTIYGDGKQLWTFADMTKGVRPADFDLDLRGVDELTIELICDQHQASSFALGDAMLYTADSALSGSREAAEAETDGGGEPDQIAEKETPAAAMWAPTIIKHPVFIPDSGTISVTAIDPNQGELHYQWYRCAGDADSFEAVAGATSASFSLPASRDTVRYYCAVWSVKDGQQSPVCNTNTVTVGPDSGEPAQTLQIMVYDSVRQEATLRVGEKIPFSVQHPAQSGTVHWSIDDPDGEYLLLEPDPNDSSMVWLTCLKNRQGKFVLRAELNGETVSCSIYTMG